MAKPNLLEGAHVMKKVCKKCGQVVFFDEGGYRMISGVYVFWCDHCREENKLPSIFFAKSC